MKFFNKNNKENNKKSIFNDNNALINSYSFYQSHRGLIKKLITIGLVSLFLSFILSFSFSSCTVGLNVPLTKEESSSLTTFNKGWYIYNDNITEPLYIFYENENKITRLGTLNKEATKEQIEKAEKTFSFYRVIKNLTYLENVDPFLDIPSWAIDFTYIDYEVYENKIEGFSYPFTVRENVDSSNNQSFLFFQYGDELIYKTFYYKKNNDIYYPIETKKPLSLYAICNDPSFSNYFEVSNSLSGSVLNNKENNLTNLTNDIIFKSIKNGYGEGNKTFNVEVHNKERGEDSYMFNIYLKL